MPVYPEFEQVTLSFSLERMREWLGPDDAIVRRLLEQANRPTRCAKRWSTARSSPIRRCAWRSGTAAQRPSTRRRIR